MPELIHPRVLFVPYNGKIADISEADTLKHSLDLETTLNETRKIIAVKLYSTLMAGSGVFYFYPNEGSAVITSTGSWQTALVIIKDGTQRLQYSQSVANDDFDLYCMGYIVE